MNDVRVGVSWTGVHGKYGGVSKTYGIPVVHGNYTRDLGNFNQQNYHGTGEYVKSWNLVEASVGVAALNSMMKPRGKKDVNAQVLIIEESQNKKVIMVGKFPKIDEIRSVAKEFWVLEADPTSPTPKKELSLKQLQNTSSRKRYHYYNRFHPDKQRIGTLSKSSQAGGCLHHRHGPQYHYV